MLQSSATPEPQTGWFALDKMDPTSNVWMLSVWVDTSPRPLVEGDIDKDAFWQWEHERSERNPDIALVSTPFPIDETPGKADIASHLRLLGISVTGDVEDHGEWCLGEFVSTSQDIELLTRATKRPELGLC